MSYTRKTRDEYNIEGFYAYGWETVTCEDTWREAREMLKCYRENEPGTAFRIKKARVKL